ncbi:NAD(P)-binding protein [Serendipita vermifera]|nr:NAD(P)-binding protein [Serendipita vermifera]
MASKPIITVFLATGKTGGGTIDAILADGTYAARAVTRNPNSDAAKALAARGVEVVQGDLSDPASIERAVEGAYGVLGATDFWSSFFDEEKQGKSLVNAAKKVGVKHFVWVTLDHSGVPHFDTKARVDDYLKESGVPRTSLYTAFFVENIGNPYGFAIKRDEGGNILFDLAFKTDGPIPIIAASDIGKWALVAFKNPDEWIGKDLKVVVEWKTPREIAKIVEEELGEKVVIKEVDEAQWKANKTAVPNFEEFWLNLQFYYDIYPHGNGRDAEFSKGLISNPITVRDYVRAKGKSLISA